MVSLKEAEDGDDAGFGRCRGELVRLAETVSVQKYLDELSAPVDFAWHHKMLRYQQQLEQEEAAWQKRQSLRSKIWEKQEQRRKARNK